MISQKNAKYGRGGDTEIRKVGGRPAHVNLLEAYLIDNYGKEGEAIAKKYGSGTINPKTGLKEYSKISEWWDNTKAKVLGSDLGEQIIDTAGIESGIEAINLVGDSIQSLQEQYEKTVGPRGYLQAERGLATKTLGNEYLKTTGDIDASGKEMSRKSNLATHTGMTRKLEDASKFASTKYETGMEKTELGFRKGEASFIADLRKQMSNLLVQYHQAAGQAYTGDWETTTKGWRSSV